jgi:transcriptional regulator with XRE-family HTH domain
LSLGSGLLWPIAKFFPECAIGLFCKNTSRVIALFSYDQHTGHMQEVFSTILYADVMRTDNHGADLKSLREAAGLSQRALARMVGETQSNIQYWEAAGKIPRSDVLAPMAKALGITVEELLGEQTKRKTKPGGKLGQVFEEVAALPRRQQQKIVDVVEALVAQHSSTK